MYGDSHPNAALSWNCLCPGSIVSSDLYAQTPLNFVTYLRAEGVDHTLKWNAHPQAYEETLTTFLCSPTELMSKYQALFVLYERAFFKFSV